MPYTHAPAFGLPIKRLSLLPSGRLPQNPNVMKKVNVKCYNPTKSGGELDVFILSKGNNAGKPMWQPCPNCFVFTAKNKAEQEEMYWLLYGLWQGSYFSPFISGSVIPFIRKRELCQVINLALEKVQTNQEKFGKAVSMLQLLDAHSENIHEQIKLIKQAKKALMYKVFL